MPKGGGGEFLDICEETVEHREPNNRDEQRVSVRNEWKLSDIVGDIFERLLLLTLSKGFIRRQGSETSKLCRA